MACFIVFQGHRLPNSVLLSKKLLTQYRVSPLFLSITAPVWRDNPWQALLRDGTSLFHHYTLSLPSSNRHTSSQ
jgi:hypothetical protein